MANANEILIEIARAVQKFGMYTESHPSRASTADELLASLVSHLSEEEEFVIKVARDHLIIGDEKTRTDNAALTNLARRLHQHQLFVITFKKGVEQTEVAGFLSVIAVQVGHLGVPFGVSAEEELKQWSHIGIEPTPYASLRLSGKTDLEEERSGDALDGTSTGGGTEVDGTDDKMDDTGEISAEELELQKAISNLLSNLDTGARQSLLKMFKSILSAGGVDGSPERAIPQLAELAKAGDNRPATVILSLITKVGRQLGVGGTDGPDITPGQILEAFVNQLAGRTAVTEATTEPLEPAVKPEWIREIDSLRILQISIEVDEMTPAAQKHLKVITSDGKLEILTQLFEDAPEENQAMKSMLDQLSKPATLIKLFAGDPPNFDSIDRLLPELGITAAGPMLDLLIESENVETRNGFADRLARFGDEVGPLAVERLEGAPWQASVSLLTLLGGFSEMPEGFSFSAFYMDDDRRVRRLALEMGLKKGENRGQAIISALRDPDQGIVAFGLEEVARECPPAAFTRIISMVKDGKEPTAVRRAAIRALGSFDSPEVLNALLQLTWQRKFFFLYGLTPNTPEMLEALTVLVSRWSSNPKAKKVLHSAYKSKDPRVKTVVGNRGGS